MTIQIEVPERLWQRAERLAHLGLGGSAEQVLLSAAESFLAYLEQRAAADAELGEADLWEASHPENVQRWWYNLGQQKLAAVWEHPDEDIYTVADGEPV
jgi:hypothetical protein